MENDSKVPAAGTAVESVPATDEFLMAVRDLMISPDDKWDMAPEPQHSAVCNRLRVFGIYRGRVDPSSKAVQCKMWDHRGCAEKHACDELALVRRLLGESTAGFVAIIPVADFMSDRISKRRSERSKQEGEVWYRWYLRDDGFVWVVASHRLNGTKPPMAFNQTDTPMRWIAAALRLPGVLRADGSNVRQWTGDDDTDDEEFENQTAGTDYVHLGRAKGDEEPELIRAAAAEAERRSGIEIDLLDPVKRTGGITWDLWAECLKFAWDQR
jgi:hypothetical protein